MALASLDAVPLLPMGVSPLYVTEFDVWMIWSTLILIALASRVVLKGVAKQHVELPRGLAASQNGMLVAAHRGASYSAPENTLASIVAAGKQGAHGVEFDIQRSADGEIFLLHDDTLRRTARANCPSTLLDAGTYSQEDYDRLLDQDVSTLSYWDFIGHVDVGTWKGSEFSDQRPCLMSEAMKQLADDQFALCEIKGGDMAAARDVTSLVAREGWNGNKLVFIGFDFSIMVEVKRLLMEKGCQDVKVISIKDAYTEEAAKQHLRDAKLAGLDGVDFEADDRVVTCEVVDMAKSYNLHIGVWVWAEHLPDGDTPQNLSTFRDLGVTFFTSDMPPEVCSCM